MTSSESTLGLKEGGIPHPFCLSVGWMRREQGALTGSLPALGTPGQRALPPPPVTPLRSAHVLADPSGVP